MVISRKALCALAMACLCLGAGMPVNAAPAAAVQADFAGEAVSDDVRYAVEYILQRRDHQGLPFAIVDKRDAKLYLFDPRGRLVAASPALLGLARGDHSVPGVGDLPPARIPVSDRTTPAGRFVTEPGRNLEGEHVVWMDYDAGLAIHRVRPGLAQQARLQRLASGEPEAQRVSAGCVVVPVAFYEEHVQRHFGRGAGVVYVLPETRSVEEMFAAASGA
jgi:hypothetical protein